MTQRYQHFLFLSLCLIAGCVPESDNDLPATLLHDDERIVGEFRSNDEKDRTKARIHKVHDKNGHYVILDEKKAERVLFRLFKIGDQEFISVKLKNAEGVEFGGYMFGRLSVSRTQLAVEMLQGKWFIANPEAVPGTEIDLRFKKVRLQASPRQLEHFFQGHADSRAVFDVEHPIIYKRAGT